MMRREGREMQVVLLLAVFLLACCIPSGCRKRTAPPVDVAEKSAVPQAEEKKPAEEGTLKAEFQKAKITWDDEHGRRVWEAEFQEAIASRTDDDAVVELRGVKASLYKDGKVASSMIAPRVVADSRSKEVRASGGVKIASADGAQAHSERVVWNSRDDKIVGRGAVRMTRGNITVTANSFETDTALQKARFADGEMSLE